MLSLALILNKGGRKPAGDTSDLIRRSRSYSAEVIRPDLMPLVTEAFVLCCDSLKLREWRDAINRRRFY